MSINNYDPFSKFDNNLIEKNSFIVCDSSPLKNLPILAQDFLMHYLLPTQMWYKLYK